MKKLIALLLCCLLLTGCTGPEPEETEPETLSPKLLESLPAAEATLPPVPEESLWASVKDLTFCFSSGAGAWRCLLTIDGQGNFSGDYVDTDLGDTGEGYPGGTRYESRFTGSFGDPQPDGPGSYGFHLENLEDTLPLGSEIQGDVMVHTVHADQLDGDFFLLFIPGKATSELPMGSRDWLPFPQRDRARLDCYVLCNMDREIAFVSDPAEPWLAGRNLLDLAREEADFLTCSVDMPGLSQDDLNHIAEDVYRCWDTALNDLWAMLQESLDPEDMAELLASQRQWILDKEAAAEESAAEVKGGSLYPLCYYQTAAQWTEDRVEFLTDFLPKG